MRKWLVAGATAAALFCSAGAAPASLVKVDLVVDGEVVSARTTAQLGLYGPDAKQDNPTLKCVFGQICSVPAGTYQMDVVADDLILVRRPTMHVDASEEGDRINSARLEAVRSAWIVADLPTQDGYRLDVVDISSGGVFHGLFGPERSRLKVPARKLVGALRDGSRHLGLFRLAPKAGEVVRLQPPPSPAKGRGQLLCSFDFPEPSGPPGYTQLSPTLVQGEQERPPDIVVTGSPMHVWAIWFDVPAGKFKVVTHDSKWVPRLPVEGEIPERGTLSLQRLAVIQKPSLSTTLTLSERLGVTPVEMTLFDCAAVATAGWPIRLSRCTTVARGAGETGSPVLFEHLTPSFFALQWRASHFTGIHVIDMRDGASRTDTFDAQVLRLSGRVLRGNTPVPTTVTFVDGASGTEYQGKSDDSGQYEVLVCPRSAYVVSVHVEGQGDYSSMLDVLKDTVFDIKLPLNAVSIRVVDRNDGIPVPRATVKYVLRGGEVSPAAVVTSDESGRVTLPPLQSGTLVYRATAEGYSESAEQTFDVADSTVAEVPVLLKRKSGTTLQVREADGMTPAAGAMVSWRDGQVAGPVDNDGVVRVTESIADGAGVAVANSRGEISVFRWQSAGENVFRMEPGGQPVTVRFDDAGKPVRYQLPRYSLDGIAIPHPFDMQARLKGGGDANSRLDGTMVIPGLPGRGLLTVWPALHPELGQTVSLPWSEVVRLQAVKYGKAP